MVKVFKLTEVLATLVPSLSNAVAGRSRQTMLLLVLFLE